MLLNMQINSEKKYFLLQNIKLPKVVTSDQANLMLNLSK